MTEPEAEAWKERLTRVWRVRAGELRYQGLEAPMFRGQLVNRLFLTCWDMGAESSIWLRDGTSRIALSYLEGDIWDMEAEGFEQFAARWMDFFRSRCWLCGCPIEATSHEKAEWMREFREEEIESWILKI